MLKLKLQYFGHLMQRANSLEKILILGKIEGRRRRGQQRRDGWTASLTQRTWVWANSGRQWRTKKTGVLQFMGSQRVGHDTAIEQQQFFPLQSSLSELAERLTPEEILSFVNKIKHSSQLLHCEIFFSRQHYWISTSFPNNIKYWNINY